MISYTERFSQKVGRGGRIAQVRACTLKRRAKSLSAQTQGGPLGAVLLTPTPRSPVVQIVTADEERDGWLHLVVPMFGWVQIKSGTGVSFIKMGKMLQG